MPGTSWRGAKIIPIREPLLFAHGFRVQGKILNAQLPGILLTHGPCLGACSQTSYPSARVRSSSTASFQRPVTSTVQSSPLGASLYFSLSKGVYWFPIPETAQVHGFLSVSLFTSLYIFLTFHCRVSLFVFFIFISVAFCVSLCVFQISFWCRAFLGLYQYLPFHLHLCFILVFRLLVFLSPISFIIFLMIVFLGPPLNFFVCQWLFGLPLSVSISPAIFHGPSHFWRMLLVCLHDISTCDCLFLYLLLSLPISAFVLEMAHLCQVPIRFFTQGRKFLRHVIEIFYVCWLISLRGGQRMDFSLNWSEAILCFIL